MTQHTRAKVVFMIPFDFSHFQEAFNEFQTAGVAGITSGRLVLTNISALKFARAIHRRQPTAHMTQEAERSANDCRANFPTVVRAGAELCEHLTHKVSMSQLVLLNHANSVALRRRTHGLPMAAISVRCCQFA